MNIVITNVFGYVNKGDWALLAAIEKLLNETFPGAKIKGICRDPDAQAKYFPRIQWIQQLGASSRLGMARRIENVSGLLGGVLRHFLPTLSEKTEWGVMSVPACFKDADLIVCCPGGYLEDSNYSIWTNLVHLWLGVQSSAPVILAPQSIGPFKNRFIVFLTSFVINKTTLICVREEISREIVINQLNVPENKVVLLSDMAFYESEVDVQTALNKCLELGFTTEERFACGTMINWYFPFTFDPERQREQYKKEYALAIKKIYIDFGMRTLLLKQVEPHPGGLGDDELIKSVAELAGEAAICAFENFPPQIMKGIIGRASVFLGSRMHSNIFALQVGTPVVAIAYLPKTVGIMNMCNLNEFVVNIEKIEGGDICKRMINAINEKEKFIKAQKLMRELGEEDKKKLSEILAISISSSEEPADDSISIKSMR